jgi:hypothetical protein
VPDPAEDPRLAPRAEEEVPALVAEGARRYNAGDFWHAHESWEEAWHALRAVGRHEDAAFLQGLVFVTAALENLKRGKAGGFRRQLAKAVLRLGTLAGRGDALGMSDEAGFVAAVARLQAATAGGPLRGLADLPEPPPPLRHRLG